MFPFNSRYFVLFMSFSTVYISTSTFAAPVSDAPDNAYDSFIQFLVKSNCSMPSVVKIPFPKPDDSPFSYLSNPLKECRTSDALKDSDEAKSLCSEIFDALQNITCVEYKTPLPEIQSQFLPEDVCNEFQTKRFDFPKKQEYLSWRLEDSLVCKILCADEKYHNLCETLLWSYDLQVKIKSALKSTEGDNFLNKSDLGKKSSPSVKVNLVTVTTDSPKQKNNDNNSVTGSDGSTKVQPSVNITTTKKEALNNLETASSNDKTSVTHDSSAVNDQKGNSLAVINTTETTTGKKGLTKDKVVSKAGKSEENLQGNPESKEQQEPQAETANDNDNPVNSHPETVTVEASSSVVPEGEDAKNSVVQNQQPSAEGEEALVNPLSGHNVDNSATKVSVVSENTNKDDNSAKNVQVQQKSTINVTKPNGVDVNEQSDENPAPEDTENELSNVNLDGQEENESKVDESNLKMTDDGKKAEKPVLPDLEPPIGVGSETDAKPTESLPDKIEEEHQAERDPEDPYNDNESEDYPKSDYGPSFDPFSKNKEDNKNSDLEGPNPVLSNYGTFKSRSNIGRIPDEGPLISAFPEQEDGHFFFYLLSIVLILMAGYLIFHNKQKIIALIVEGRHERRRRSHGSGYKKLDTK